MVNFIFKPGICKKLEHLNPVHSDPRSTSSTLTTALPDAARGYAPKYEAVVEAIRSTKGELEAALSKHFDGRRVNLMGEINQLAAL